MITDEKGNKLPQPWTDKKVQSRNVRLRRMGKMAITPFCLQCGYRDRGPNHLESEHHQKGKVTE